MYILSTAVAQGNCPTDHIEPTVSQNHSHRICFQSLLKPRCWRVRGNLTSLNNENNGSIVKDPPYSVIVHDKENRSILADHQMTRPQLTFST